jgi:sensor histidine kinase YesM
LNDKKEILVSNSVGDQKGEGFRKALLDKVSGPGANGKWTGIDGENYLICQAEYEDYALDLVSVVSDKALWEQLNPVLWTLALAFLVNCFIVVLLAYVVTRRNFNQISYVIDTFNKAELGIYPEESAKGKINDEYDLIMNNIVNMFINTTYLNSQLEQKQYKQKVAELTALQAQINPHFLFNTLQTINFELLRRQNEEMAGVSTIIQELSEILKYALMPSTQLVPLKQEIEYLKKYIEIQKYRFSDMLVVYYQVEDSIQDHPVSRLILQPLVENSILHGVRYIDKTGYIKVKILRRQDALCFSVTDNGIGMDRQEVLKLEQQIMDENGTGIGLANVNQRLRLNYGEDSRIRIRSKKGRGTSVSFQIPYTPKE